MKNRRVYIVITTFLPLVGGAETQTFAQAQRLSARLYEPTIVTFRHKKSWLPRETIGAVPVIRVAGKLLGNRERFPRLFQRLAYLLAMLVMTWTIWRHRKDFDVLQVCQLNLLVLPLALLCRLTDKPMTVVVISAGAGRVTKSSAPARLTVVCSMLARHGCRSMAIPGLMAIWMALRATASSCSTSSAPNSTASQPWSWCSVRA